MQTSDLVFLFSRMAHISMTVIASPCRLLRGLHRARYRFHTATLIRRHVVEILYLGRTSEFLMTTSECLRLPAGHCTLKQLLDTLALRDARWQAELHSDHLICTGQGRRLRDTDHISVGDTLCLQSSKSIFDV